MNEFNRLMQAQFNKMCQTGKLFRSYMTGQEVWNLYLNSFEQDPIFRDPASSEHNCNLCNNFIRRYGNIIALDSNNVIMTLFDFESKGEYEPVSQALAFALHNSVIKDVFFETFYSLNSLNYEKCKNTNTMFKLGIPSNVKRYTKEEAEKFGVVKANQTITFSHMHLDVPVAFVDKSGSSVESIMGEYRSAYDVFQRGMNEIPLEVLELVRDLIRQGSLLNGDAHLYKVEQTLALKKQFNDLPESLRANWCWANSYKFPLAKFKNELIGVLCSEIAEGKELNEACKAWNIRVDPANYMKAVAPITKQQIALAQQFVEENDYVESFDRRFATIDDIKVSEILHSNIGNGKIKSVNLFDSVKPTATKNSNNSFDGIEEVSIDKFMSDILPNCTSVEAFLQNRHSKLMVSLTTANNPDSKPIFKWPNNYSWTFNGNIAGASQIKQAVKAAGGKVDAVLRYSISWNEDGQDILDFDAHAVEPNGSEIFYGNYKGCNNKTMMSGNLDVDMIRPSKMGVENITWSDQSKMKDGKYRLFINNYDKGRNHGFKAEVEFNGETYTYVYDKPVTLDINIAIVTLKDGKFSIEHCIPESGISSKEIYGLESNNFHKVNLICLSPNHWGDSNIGNKHYFFMLDECKCPTSIRSFHAENLIPELAEHRKVLEVLGATTMIEPSDKQLSGLGFNSTVRDELIVKVSGSHKRVLKIKF